MKKVLGLLGCVAAIVAVLGITIGGFSIGTWLLAAGWVKATTAASSPAAAAGPGSPNIRLGAPGGHVTVLVLDELTSIVMAADLNAMKSECRCEPHVIFASAP